MTEERTFDTESELIAALVRQFPGLSIEKPKPRRRRRKLKPEQLTFEEQVVP